MKTSYDDVHAYNLGCDPLTKGKDLLEIARALDLSVVGVQFEIEPEGKNLAYTNIIKLAKEVFDIASSVGFNFNQLSLGSGFPPESLSEVSCS